MDQQRQAGELEDKSEHVDDLIDEARSDWERKKGDPKVPGAGGDPEPAGGQGPETTFPGAGGTDDVPESAAEADRVADEAAED